MTVSHPPGRSKARHGRWAHGGETGGRGDADKCACSAADVGRESLLLLPSVLTFTSALVVQRMNARLKWRLVSLSHVILIPRRGYASMVERLTKDENHQAISAVSGCLFDSSLAFPGMQPLKGHQLRKVCTIRGRDKLSSLLYRRGR